MSKNKKATKKKKRGAKRVIRNIILIIVIIIVAALIGGMAMFQHKYGTSVFACAKEAKILVDNSTAETFMPNSASYIYSADGTQLAKLYENTESTYLEFQDIPENVRNAFVAVEDRTFWKNSGVDMKGIVRVSLNYLKTRGGTAHGASTITQQLARDVFLTNEKSLERKVKEIFISLEITKKYSKEQILEFYCNNCCFANGIYGIEDASQKYLGKSAKDLTLSEAAYLCAIPNRPEYYNPLKDSNNAISRRDKILDNMYECDFITANERDQAKNETISIAAQTEEKQFYNYETTFAINSATEYLMENVYNFEFRYEFSDNDDYNTYQDSYNEAYQNAKHHLYTDGYQIQTSIDLDAQENLQSILNEQLSFSKKTKEDSDIYNLQGAMTAIDNETGKVIAAIGGRDQEELSSTYSLNRAYQSYRQPGSTMKPILVYTPALMKDYSANSNLPDIDVSTAKKAKSGKISSMSGSKYALRNAVENSRNGCAYWLYNEITPNYGMKFLQEMEFSKISPDDYSLSAALGGLTYGATTTEMANAYSTLANHGEYKRADCLTSIKDKSGKEIYDEPQSKEVYSAEAADEMVDIMMGVITNGTAKSINWYSNTDTEAAGKTGTTNDTRDGWFCGITPQYTIAVWVGNDDHTVVSGLYGNGYPLKIWKESMLYLIQDQKTQKFDLSVSKHNHGQSSGDEENTEETVIPDDQTTTPDDQKTTTDGQTPSADKPKDGTTTTPSGGEGIQGSITDGSGTDDGSGSGSTDGSNNGSHSGGTTDSGSGSGGDGSGSGGDTAQ